MAVIPVLALLAVIWVMRSMMGKQSSDAIGKGCAGDPAEICERYWRDPGAGAAPQAITYPTYVDALNRLAAERPGRLAWARSVLTHADYEARASAAFLVGVWGKGADLPAVEKAAIIAELRDAIFRPIGEEPKELEAIDSTIGAIGDLGDPAGIPVLAEVLGSSNESLEGDTKWSAAEALGSICGENFMEAADPIAAAREWLGAHPSATPPQ